MAFASSILVPTDLSPASFAGLAEAARIARAAPCTVFLVSVLEAGPWVLPPSVSNRESTLRRILEEASGAVQSVLASLQQHYFTGLGDVHARTVQHASAAQAICACAEQWGVDLVVLSSHGRSGPGASQIGGVTEKVVRGAHCRVLVVPAQKSEALAH